MPCWCSGRCDVYGRWWAFGRVPPRGRPGGAILRDTTGLSPASAFNFRKTANQVRAVNQSDGQWLSNEQWSSSTVTLSYQTRKSRLFGSEERCKCALFDGNRWLEIFGSDIRE